MIAQAAHAERITHDAQMIRLAVGFDVRQPRRRIPDRRGATVPEVSVVPELVQRGDGNQLGRPDEIDPVPEARRNHGPPSRQLGDPQLARRNVEVRIGSGGARSIAKGPRAIAIGRTRPGRIETGKWRLGSPASVHVEHPMEEIIANIVEILLAICEVVPHPADRAGERFELAGRSAQAARLLQDQVASSCGGFAVDELRNKVRLIGAAESRDVARRIADIEMRRDPQRSVDIGDGQLRAPVRVDQDLGRCGGTACGCVRPGRST